MEDFAIGGEGIHAFLNAGAPGVVQADYGIAHPYRQIHHFTDLLGVRFSKGTPGNGKILAENKDLAAVDRAVAGDDAVSQVALGIPQSAPPAEFEHIELLEASIVQQKIDPLARCELAGAVLGIPLGLATGIHRFSAKFFQGFKCRIVLSFHGFTFISFYPNGTAPAP